MVVGSPVPTPSSSPGALGIWVLTPLGLNVHHDPATTAPVVGTAAQGAALNVNRTRKIGADTWLQISASDQSISGWVLDQPDLVIHQNVDLHIDSDQSWSLLAPAAWNVTAPGAPAGTTTITGDGVTMTVDVEAAAPKFTPPGADVKDQQIEVYGVTTILSTYHLPDGSYEFATHAKWDRSPPTRFFAITYKEPAGTQPDSTLCLQMIDSMHIF